MKMLLLILTVFSVLGIQYGCDRRDYESKDIQREEEFDRKDIHEKGEKLPSHDGIDRDVLGDDLNFDSPIDDSTQKKRHQ